MYFFSTAISIYVYAFNIYIWLPELNEMFKIVNVGYFELLYLVYRLQL